MENIKHDDQHHDFIIVNFPYLGSKMPSSPAYGVYILQLIWYARACSATDKQVNVTGVSTVQITDSISQI
jgi:hypothetical protein